MKALKAPRARLAGHRTSADTSPPSRARGATLSSAGAPPVRDGGRCSCGGGCPRCAARHPEGGKPIDASDRTFLETRLGRQFGDVRLHTDHDAAAEAADLGARAFTRGSDISLGAQQYQPGRTAYRHLLAHELTHVVQQGTASGLAMSPQLGAPGGPLEREAGRVADAAIAGRAVSIRERASTPMIQRAPVTPAPPLTQLPLPDGRSLDGAMLEALLLAVPAIAPHVAQKSGWGRTTVGHTWFLEPTEFEDRAVLYFAPPGGTPKNDPRSPGTPFNSVTARQFSKSVNGFVDRDTKELFVKTRGGIKGDAEIVPTSVHEAVHYYANPQVLNQHGFNANEGLTDFFTAVVCAAHDIDAGGLAYDPQSSAVRPILEYGFLTLEEMATWYFQQYSTLFSDQFPDVATEWTAAMKAGSYPLAKTVLKRGKPSTP